MKRLLSLALSLVLVLGLFAGLAGSASADGEIGQIFNRYLTGDKIEEFFDGESLKHGYVGRRSSRSSRTTRAYSSRTSCFRSCVSAIRTSISTVRIC